MREDRCERERGLHGRYPAFSITDLKDPMAQSGIRPPRYQGLSAARQWRVQPSRPRDRFSLAVGDRVGDVTVIGHLSGGSDIEIYQVWSREHWCALTGKIAVPGSYRPGVMPDRMRAECSVLDKLRHPNVVRYYGSALTAGRPFILLEYLRGPSLLEMLSSLPRRRLQVPDAVRAVMHIGSAIHYLHRCGYLYRDMKPANILLRDGVPVLVDFDAAAPIDDLRPPAHRTGTGPYMAPEQVHLEPLSPATDIYGLGALLYELLTGRWPTEAPATADEVLDDDLEEFLLEEETERHPWGHADDIPDEELERYYPQIAGPPTPLGSFRKKLPPEVVQIVGRCLARDPGERYQSVSGLLAALAPLLKGSHALWPAAAPIERRENAEAR